MDLLCVEELPQNADVPRRRLVTKGKDTKRIDRSVSVVVKYKHDPTKKSLICLPADIIRMIDGLLQLREYGRLLVTCKWIFGVLTKSMMVRFEGRASRLRIDKVDLAIRYSKYDLAFSFIANGCQSRNTKIVDHFLSQGNIDAIRFLLDCNMKPSNVKMDWLASSNQLGLLKLLYEYGLECSKQGFNSACSHGHLDVIKFLYESGTRGNDCAYTLAVANKRTAVIKWLGQHNYGI